MIPRYLLSYVLLAAALIANCAAFVPASKIQQYQMSTQHSTPLYLLSGSGGGLFGLFGGQAQSQAPEDDDPEKGIPVFEIPLSAIKMGGLRVTLSFHCIGQQNSPDEGTWLVRVAEDDAIENWFNNPDQSGMFTVVLDEVNGGSIAVERHGPRPSVAYMLQENVRMHNLLDELETLAFGGEEDIAPGDRLLQLEDKDAINKAREKLPARG